MKCPLIITFIKQNDSQLKNQLHKNNFNEPESGQTIVREPLKWCCMDKGINCAAQNKEVKRRNKYYPSTRDKYYPQQMIEDEIDSLQ